MDAVPEGDVFMLRLDVRRMVAALLLVLTLVPALCWAGQRRVEPWNPSGRDGLLATLWSFVTALSEEEGGSLDPNGQPRPSEGSSLDPSGNSTDEGSDLDPSG